MIDADVIIVGAGPTGLMLATELRLGGVRTLILERQPQIRETPKAGDLSGQILELLRCREVLERFEAAGTDPIPALRAEVRFGRACQWTAAPTSPLIEQHDPIFLGIEEAPRMF